MGSGDALYARRGVRCAQASQGRWRWVTVGWRARAHLALIEVGFPDALEMVHRVLAEGDVEGRVVLCEGRAVGLAARERREVERVRARDRYLDLPLSALEGGGGEGRLVVVALGNPACAGADGERA
jgi:hypothetical protein